MRPLPMRSRPVLALLLSLAGLAAASPPAAATPYTPQEWQEDFIGPGGQVQKRLLRWNRDLDHNFVDDLIDPLPAATPVDVIVDFNRCVPCDPEPEVLEFLAQLGRVDYVGRIVTFAVVLGVKAGDAARIAAREEVAMVQLLVPSGGALDESVQAIRVEAGAFSPDTVEDDFPGIDGSGVTIAVLDSGVDDNGASGTAEHQLFPAGTFRFGANCIDDPCTIGNPDDDNGHGTGVAGVALGRIIPPTTQTTGIRGVAPAAGLVDIKVFDAQRSCDGASCLRGLELAIEQRAAWGIDVINYSIQACASDNGHSAESVLLNTAVELGLVVVVAAGNTNACTPALPANTNQISGWAAAAQVITVGAIDDHGTAALGNDTLAAFSLIGPRLDDGDGDPRDEQKPEISAPGATIRTATAGTVDGYGDQGGTSFAAPHVAGAAALILELMPGITPGSLKELLIAEVAQSNKPGAHPGWDTGWGFGFLDVRAALGRTAITDVGRPTEPPYVECADSYCSPHIQLDARPAIDRPNAITARVQNFGAAQATAVRVCFGVYVFSNNGDRFHELGCETVDIPGGQSRDVRHAWTPRSSLLPARLPAGLDLHACLRVNVDYGFDTDFANNAMQRNVSIARASTARVNFRLENNGTAPEELRVEIDNPSSWIVRLTENGQVVGPTFRLDPYVHCGRDLVIELTPPPGTPPGTEAVVNVRVFGEGGERRGGVTIVGQVSGPDCNRNGVADAEDVASGTSQDLNGNGRPDECELRAVVWVFRGTAQGAQVEATLRGIGGPCTVTVATVAGQTAAAVAAGFAAAAEASACLTGQGVSATAAGGTVTLRGLDLELVSDVVSDPGLVHSMPIASVPLLSWPGALALVLLLAVAAMARLASPG